VVGGSVVGGSVVGGSVVGGSVVGGAAEGAELSPTGAAASVPASPSAANARLTDGLATTPPSATAIIASGYWIGR
jgi:hypothetical protein